MWNSLPDLFKVTALSPYCLQNHLKTFVFSRCQDMSALEVIKWYHSLLISAGREDGCQTLLPDLWLQTLIQRYLIECDSSDACCHGWVCVVLSMIRLWWYFTTWLIESHHYRHSWYASLGVRSAKCRHQSPEWTILSHISCFIEEEVVGFRALLNSLRLHSTRASWWSSPVLQGEAIKMILASVSSGIRTLCPNREKPMSQTSVVDEYWGWVL